MWHSIKNLFSKKQQNIKNVEITNSVVLQVGGDVKLDSELSEILNVCRKDTIFLNQLVKEKLEESKNLIIEIKAKDASRIIDTIYIAGLKSIDVENSNLLNYLKALTCILDGDIEKAELTREFIENNNFYKMNIMTAIKINNTDITEFVITDELKEDRLLSCIILQILFGRKEFGCIIANFKPTAISFHVQDYFYGLASQNEHNFTESVQALEIANTKKSTPQYLFCKVIGQINLRLSQIKVNDLDLELLDSEYKQLLEIGNTCTEFREANSFMYNFVKLKVLLVMEAEEFLDEYSSLSEEQRNDVNFRFLLGNYYQIQKGYDNAISIYVELIESEIITEVTYSIMICYLFQKKYADIIELFEGADTPQVAATITIYLIAIHHQTPDDFDVLFNKYFYDNCNGVDDLFSFLDLYDYNAYVKEALYIKIDEFKYQIIETSKVKRIMFAFFVVEIPDMDLSKLFLASIKNYTPNDLDMVCSLLSHITDIKLREEVAEWFVDNNLKSPAILNIQAGCYMNRKKDASAFSLLQESFAIYQDKQVAVKLVNLAAIIDTVKISDIQEYLDFISLNNEPQILLIAAQTYCKFGLYDKAEALSYKAIYLLNNYDDSQLFRLYLSIYFKMISSVSREKIEFDRVNDDVVVILSPFESDYETVEETTPLVICINQELDLCNNNNAIGALHVSKTSLLYLKLNNKKIQDTIVHNGQSYKIESIINKHVHTFRYILLRVDDSKDDYFLRKISIDINKDVKQQIHEVLCEYKPTDNLLDSYYFKDNPVGLPIECINHCEYDDYVKVVRFLLYSEKEVLYAGLNQIEFDLNQSYVITLPTLVISKILDQLSLLKHYRANIFISETLLNFIKERSENASKTLVVSPGKIFFNEWGDLLLDPSDKSMPDFWNAIYEISLEFNLCGVTSDDRFDFIKQHSGIDVEEFFAKTQVHICQWDSLIVAQKHSLVLLSDDLFFRRWGEGIGIQSVNHIYLYPKMKFEEQKEAYAKLLKTNYVYIPTIQIDHSYALEYLKSISSNDRKRRAYAELLPVGYFLKDIWSQ